MIFQNAHSLIIYVWLKIVKTEIDTENQNVKGILMWFLSAKGISITWILAESGKLWKLNNIGEQTENILIVRHIWFYIEIVKQRKKSVKVLISDQSTDINSRFSGGSFLMFKKTKKGLINPWVLIIKLYLWKNYCY